MKENIHGAYYARETRENTEPDEIVHTDDRALENGEKLLRVRQKRELYRVMDVQILKRQTPLNNIFFSLKSIRSCRC